MAALPDTINPGNGRETEDDTEGLQRVFVMRHGARYDTANPQWERTTDRPYDTPLTTRGKIQACSLSANRYGGKDIKKVISSPFLRCLQTAQEACKALNHPGIITRNSLSEICTPANKMGGPPKVPDSPTVLQEYNITILEYDTGPLPKYPEDINMACNRYRSAITSIANEYYPDNLLLVTHQYGVEQAMGMATGKKYVEYEVAYCGNVELVRSSQEDQWTLTSKQELYKYDTVIN